MRRLIKIILYGFIINFASFPALPRQILNQNQKSHLLQLARNFEARSQFEQALEIYERLWKDEPANINYYRGVKNNLIRLSRFDEAEKNIKKMIKMNSSIIIMVDLADIYFKKENKKEALDIWNSVINQNPKNQSAYQIVASSLRSNLLYDEAIEIYQQGQRALNNESLFLIEMANLYRARGDYISTVEFYLKYLEFYPKQYSFVETNVTSLSDDSEHVVKIIDFIKGRIEKNKNDLHLRNILAALYLRSSNYKAALEEYSIIDQYIMTRPKREKDKVGRELFRFAQNAFNDEAYAYAIEAYQLILNRYPESNYSPQCQFGIAQSYEEMGNYQQAITKYQEIISKYNIPHIRKDSFYRIGVIQLDYLSDADNAEKYFRKVVEISPMNEITYQAMFRIGECHLIRENLDDAIAQYRKISDNKAIDHHFIMRAVFNIGRLHFWQGNLEEAQACFKQIQSDPINITNQNDGLYVNDALEYSLFIEHNKEITDVLKKFAQADLMRELKKYNTALNLLLDLVKEEKSQPIADRAWFNIGELQRLLGNHRQAIQAFQMVTKNFVNSVHTDKAQKMIGDVYQMGINDTTQAVKAYEQVLTNYPNSIFLEEVRTKIRALESENK